MCVSHMYEMTNLCSLRFMHVWQVCTWYCADVDVIDKVNQGAVRGWGRVPSSLTLNMFGYSNLSIFKVEFYMVSHFTVVLQLGHCSTTAGAE